MRKSKWFENYWPFRREKVSSETKNVCGAICVLCLEKLDSKERNGSFFTNALFKQQFLVKFETAEALELSFGAIKKLEIVNDRHTFLNNTGAIIVIKKHVAAHALL